MLAFQDPRQAVEWALMLQEALLKCVSHSLQHALHILPCYKHSSHASKSLTFFWALQQPMSISWLESSTTLVSRQGRQHILPPVPPINCIHDAWSHWHCLNVALGISLTRVQWAQSCMSRLAQHACVRTTSCLERLLTRNPVLAMECASLREYACTVIDVKAHHGTIAAV